MHEFVLLLHHSLLLRICLTLLCKTSFDKLCCWIIASRTSVLSSFFNFNSFSRNSWSYSNFSLRNEKVSLLHIRDLSSDDVPFFNTYCDSLRFFIAISHMFRAFCLSTSTRASFCSVICSCFESLSLLMSPKSCSRVSYSVGSAPPSPEFFFTIILSRKRFQKIGYSIPNYSSCQKESINCI